MRIMTLACTIPAPAFPSVADPPFPNINRTEGPARLACQQEYLLMYGFMEMNS